MGPDDEWKGIVLVIICCAVFITMHLNMKKSSLSKTFL
uniref:PhoR n=1 Tax=Bacillus subtilis TaxID=1423 RepID=Q53328_BACIU